jgi:hypothetical protein
MFARRKVSGSCVRDLERIEDLVRSRFAVGDDQIVLVSEDDTQIDGAPERMTTVLFWTAGDLRHKVRIFKAADQIAEADLPPGWLRGALLDDGDADCC